MPSLRLASLALMLFVLTLTPAGAQLVPKASPITPVESANLNAVGDIYPGAVWAIAPLAPAVDEARLMTAINAAFATPAPTEMPGTRGLVIIHHGSLVYERYADGFSAGMRFPGWSMAKALINAGVGILTGENRLNLLSAAPLPEWSDPKDPRHAVTVRELLLMTSGLDWPDAPDVPAAKAADVQMLFGRGRSDMAAFAAKSRIAHDPGRVFQYASGSSVLLASIMAQTIAPDAKTPEARRLAVQAFYYQRLFEPIGIKSAVLEFDKSGTFTGSTYVHMTAQDYARLGYLYLRGGDWNGMHVLPPQWVEFTTTQSGAQNSSAYGAHFWLMTRKAGDDAPPPPLPDEPSAFMAAGYNGQVILIVPSRSLVIVRLGNSPSAAWPAIHAFLREIVGCFPANGS